MNINERIEKAIAKGNQLVYYKPKEKGTYYPKDVGCCWNHTKNHISKRTNNALFVSAMHC